MEYMKVKVGDRVRRTQEPLSETYVGAQSMNDLQSTIFRVVAVHRSEMVYLEVFNTDGALPQGKMLVVPEVYFTPLYWQSVPPLILQVAATKQDRGISQFLVKEKHYMQSEIPDIARPMAYLVLREHDREPLGTIIYTRPQCARAYGSSKDERVDLGRGGNIHDVRSGRCQRTQWEEVCLARFYLDPCLQKRDSRDYIANAASILLAQSLWSVCVDYLKYFPPAYFNEPWELKECVSYCRRDRFFCTLYLASSFHLVRTNKKGLQTYARALRGLMPHEKKEIRQASQMSQWAREHRAERTFTETMTSQPILRRAAARTMTNVA
jgi:hypothetical protein